MRGAIYLNEVPDEPKVLQAEGKIGLSYPLGDSGVLEGDTCRLHPPWKIAASAFSVASLSVITGHILDAPSKPHCWTLRRSAGRTSSVVSQCCVRAWPEI